MDWLKVLDIAEKGAIIAGAAATSFLAYYALYGEERRKRRKLPELSIKVHEKWGHDTQDDNTGISMRYYTVKLENKRKHSEAKKVRARLLKLHKKGENGYRVETPPAPLHFNWAATPSEFGIYSHSPLSNFTTYDAFALGYGEITDRGEIEFFNTETNPTRNSFEGTIKKNQKAIFEIEVSGENIINSAIYYLHLGWGVIPGVNEYERVAPFITKISEHEFNQLIAS